MAQAVGPSAKDKISPEGAKENSPEGKTRVSCRWGIVRYGRRRLRLESHWQLAEPGILWLTWLSRKTKDNYKQWQEALKRIEHAKKSNASELTLSYLGLTTLPATIGQLVNLKSLNINKNQLSTLPESLGQLTSLRILDVARNQLSALPESIGRLTNLEMLTLADNRLEALPESLGQLRNLRVLDLDGNWLTAAPNWLGDLKNLNTLDLLRNRIEALPECLTELHNLHTLRLSGNPLATLPAWLGKLTSLQSLWLSNLHLTSLPMWLTQLTNLEEIFLHGNDLNSLPEWLGQLTGLKRIYLSRNNFASIPDWFVNLTKLERLDLSANQITAMPEWFGQLTNLRELLLDGNQITKLPESFGQLQELRKLELEGNPIPSEILAALKSGIPTLLGLLSTGNKVYPRTVKMILLGEPKSGKTTLLEALKGNKKPCDPKRAETVGVNVEMLERKHPEDGESIFLSAWDFAGQHMEHATHQFYLSEGAIYLILWNAREGADAGQRDLWYWLELLRMRVRDPKFLLVATHAELTPPDLNLSDIKRFYRGFEGSFAVELCSLGGLDALQEGILKLATASPSMQAPWKREWLKVRDKLREIKTKQPHITPAALRILMRENGVMGKDDQKDLAHYLHYLGEILYFQEREELAGLVILDPEWVTEMIGLVVRSVEARKRDGMLRKADLDELWRKYKLSSKVRDHLIRLMDSFDLTYSTEHTQEVGIVVEALPFSTPDLLSKMELPSDQPHAQMIFRFPLLQRHLPPGVPTWGIARLHRYLDTEHGKPCRDAAAFRDKISQSRALITASDNAREIRLHVTGDYPPHFFGVILATLRDTFKRYPGAEPEYELPCCCRPGCDFSYRYDVVMKRRKENKVMVTCGKSADDVAIESLLSGARPPETEEGWRAVLAEVRRNHTAMLQWMRGQNEKTFPLIFTLAPSKGFKQLDSWAESATKDEELDLTLYCEDDSGWHTTSHSVYRFKPDLEWFATLKERWNSFLEVTKGVGKLASHFGKEHGGEIVGLGTEMLPKAPQSVADVLSKEIGKKKQAGLVDIEMRDMLGQLIAQLDERRSVVDHRNGGLSRYFLKDGRVLWLCPKHGESYRTR